jgi:hypothetical protein
VQAIFNLPYGRKRFQDGLAFFVRFRGKRDAPEALKDHALSQQNLAGPVGIVGLFQYRV